MLSLATFPLTLACHLRSQNATGATFESLCLRNLLLVFLQPVPLFFSKEFSLILFSAAGCWGGAGTRVASFCWHFRLAVVHAIGYWLEGDDNAKETLLQISRVRRCPRNASSSPVRVDSSWLGLMV